VSRSDPDLNRLFQDMASQSTTPEPADDKARRRQRAIGGMRALHRGLLDDRIRNQRARRFWSLGLVAAAVALCGTALAGHWLDFGNQRTPAPPKPASVVAQSSVSPLRPTPSATRIEPLAEPASPLGLGTTALPASAPSKVASNELAEVNRLFAEAKLARREHRDADALASLERLQAKHGGSVLAQEAAVERFRALARLGRSAEARRFARQYLTSYPNGFAESEARRLLEGEAP
jgi:hypothetical protein